MCVPCILLSSPINSREQDTDMHGHFIKLLSRGDETRIKYLLIVDIPEKTYLFYAEGSSKMCPLSVIVVVVVV